MSYRNVENLLRDCPEPEMYNFEREYENKEYWKLDTFERYFAYKASGENVSKYKGSAYTEAKKFVENNKKFKDVPDGDGCGTEQEENRLVREIYRILWGWISETGGSCGKTAVGEFGLMGPDSMNSVQTVLNAIVEEIVEKVENRDLKECKHGYYSISYMLELAGNPKCREKFSSELKAEKGLEAYIEAYHTIGNFTLVPEYFNQYRGYTKAKELGDYWDRSLGKLRMKKPEEIWKVYIGKAIYEVNWDSRYFNRYINDFFLWDYMDDEGNPVRISGGDTHEFLRKAVELIKRRGRFIVFMLRLHQQLGAKRYNQMRDALFLQDDEIYRGYEDVFCKIEDYLNGSMSDECGALLKKVREELC